MSGGDIWALKLGTQAVFHRGREADDDHGLRVDGAGIRAIMQDRPTGFSFANRRSASVTSTITGVVPPTVASSAAVKSPPLHQSHTERLEVVRRDRVALHAQELTGRSAVSRARRDAPRDPGRVVATQRRVDLRNRQGIDREARMFLLLSIEWPTRAVR